MQEEIARIRGVQFSTAVEAAPSFSLSRRGYDRDDVDRFMAELADRLEEAEAERPEAPVSGPSDAMRRELERIAQKSAEFLSEAEESAERVRAEATQEASRVLARAREDVETTKLAADEARHQAAAEVERAKLEADAYAERVRIEAEADAKALRAQAASELAEAVEGAEVAARASAEDDQRRRLSVELAELAARRDAARDELRKIAGVLADAAGPVADVAPPSDEPVAADPQAPAGADAQAPLRAV